MKTNKALLLLFVLCVSSTVFMVSAKASAVNLAVVPSSWGYTQYPNIHLDYNVERTSGNPSIRLEPHTSADANYACEVDGTWYSVKPGDHIVAKIWIKVSVGTTYEQGRQFDGARLGIDMFASTSRGYGILKGPGSLGNYPIGVNPDVIHPSMMVRFGTSGWVLKQLDFIVPADTFTQVYINTGFVTCNPVRIDSFVLWMQLSQEPGDTAPTTEAWFADAELYINPNSTSTAPPGQQHYTLTVNVVGNGTVTINPQSATYLSGATVTLTAFPENENFTLSAWSGDIAGSGNPINITMDGNKMVTATFVPAIYGIPGDLNHDGKVDLKDLVLFASVWGLKKGDPGFIPEADINGDGIINLLDFVTFATTYYNSTS